MNDLALIRSFGILNRTYLAYISPALVDMGVSYSEGIFLVNIGNNDGISQEALANELAIDKAAIARAVKRLKANGFVESERSSTDHRERNLHLTDAGMELCERIGALNRQWVSTVLDGVSKEKINATVSILRTMAEKSMRAKGC